MNASNHRPTSRKRQLGIGSTILIACCGAIASSAMAQVPYTSRSGDMMMFESAGASRVVEKVRSSATGVMFAVFVKPGESVRKGQLLGHTELDATKLQLDVAKHTWESKANVESAKNQAEAWTVTREETEEAVRRRTADESRLDWASSMEKMYHSNYQGQLDAEGLQEIQYQYWKEQYDKRFFRSPVDGVVSEILVDVGKPVNYGTHVFTVSNESTFSLPVSVPAEVADAAGGNETVPVRSADGKAVSRAKVDRISEDPRSTGNKIIRLLIRAADFPASTRAKLLGMKFDVLLPPLAQAASR